MRVFQTLGSGAMTVIVAAFLLILAISYRPLFFQGQVPVDGNMTRMGYPNWALCTQFARTETSSLWNPYRNMGEPFLADPQTMVAYPVQRALIACNLSFLNFMRFWIGFHTLLAVLFMGLLAWRWFRDPHAVAAAALLAGLNGFFTSHISLPNHFASAAYVPMILYFTARPSPPLLGAAFALQWLAGFPPFTVLSGVLSLVVALLENKRAWLSWIAGGCLGAALAAFQVCPFLELLRLSVRSLALSGGAATQFSQPFGQLLKVWFLPQWYRFAPEVVGDHAVVASYVGPMALTLAAIALSRGRRREAAFAFVFFAALVLSLGSNLPGYERFAFLHLFRFPANWSLIAVYCLAILAASGVSSLRSTATKKIAVAILAIDLIGFGQYIRVAWMPPPLLEDPPPLAQALLSGSFPTRLYHTPFLTDRYDRQPWKGMGEYLFMKESLMPSHGMAFGVREVKSYQVLTLKSADLYQRRLLTEGTQSPLAKYAGISTAVTLRAGADRVERKTLHILQLPSPEKPVFILNRTPNDHLYSVQQSPGHCEIELECGSPHCVVVFSEMNYPGWRLSIDGIGTPPETFEQAFLAARITRSKHRLVFDFTSPSFHKGCVVSLVALAFLLMGGIASCRCKTNPTFDKQL